MLYIAIPVGVMNCGSLNGLTDVDKNVNPAMDSCVKEYVVNFIVF